jgi:hypothetical protein
MKLQERIEILVRTGEYITERSSSPLKEQWGTAIEKAFTKNPWFTPENIRKAAASIAINLLQPDALASWAEKYNLTDAISPKKIGIVMAGNIPMVGFHDLLCTFISGHHAVCKLSSKDDVLLKDIVERMTAWNPMVKAYIQFADRLNGCDGYIATGSDNSARYFNYYFGKYPSVIRKNRTSVAVLTGRETDAELEGLADDIMTYFGLGCRNVTQVYVPKHYDFLPLMNALQKYNSSFHHTKYRNNYDYQLAIYIMNNRYYMTNDVVVLLENDQPFSPIGTLHYTYYENETDVYSSLKTNPSVQAIVGAKGIPFGQTQSPSLTDYADGVDVMEFLNIKPFNPIGAS